MYLSWSSVSTCEGLRQIRNTVSPLTWQKVGHCGEGGLVMSSSVRWLSVCGPVPTISLVIAAPQCQTPESPSHLCLFVCSVFCGDKGAQIVSREVPYPTARLNQIYLDKFEHLKWCPCLLRRGFPACLSERDAILRHNTFQLRTHKYLSPPPKFSLCVYVHRVPLTCKWETRSRCGLLSQTQLQYNK